MEAAPIRLVLVAVESPSSPGVQTAFAGTTASIGSSLLLFVTLRSPKSVIGKVGNGPDTLTPPFRDSECVPGRRLLPPPNPSTEPLGEIRSRLDALLVKISTRLTSPSPYSAEKGPRLTARRSIISTGGSTVAGNPST